MTDAPRSIALETADGGRLGFSLATRTIVDASNLDAGLTHAVLTDIDAATRLVPESRADALTTRALDNLLTRPAWPLLTGISTLMPHDTATLARELAGRAGGLVYLDEDPHGLAPLIAETTSVASSDPRASVRDWLRACATRAGVEERVLLERDSSRRDATCVLVSAATRPQLHARLRTLAEFPHAQELVILHTAGLESEVERLAAEWRIPVTIWRDFSAPLLPGPHTSDTSLGVAWLTRPSTLKLEESTGVEPAYVVDIDNLDPRCDLEAGLTTFRALLCGLLAEAPRESRVRRGPELMATSWFNQNGSGVQAHCGSNHLLTLTFFSLTPALEYAATTAALLCFGDKRTRARARHVLRAPRTESRSA